MLHKEWIEYLKRENETSNNFKNYYMSRKLRRFIRIDRKLQDTKKNDKDKEKNSDDFIIVHTKEEFNEKCSQNLKNVHHLIQDQSNPNHLLWQNSNGPISTLKKFVIMNDKECEESIDEEAIFQLNHEKVLIISAEPGMGKSLILDNFTQNSTSDNFFVKIILNTCKKTLSDTNFKENLPKDLIEFVLKSLLNKTNQQEISLLKHLAKDEKLILMFDGLDEVTDYKEQVIDLIDALDKDKRIKKILITTRNQLREELEDHFGTFSFNLNNFNDEDQKNFLVKYWRNLSLQNKETRATSAVLRQSAEDLIKKIKAISSQSLNELIGIPLQTRMLADIYLEKVKDEEEFSNLVLTNIADLYNQFIESKTKIQYKKIGIEIENDEELFEEQKDKFYANHIKLSSSILFENQNKKLDNDFKEKDEKKIMKYGIVVAFTNKTPSFLHQSFAEFFLAKSCLQKIKEQKRIKDDKEFDQILREERHFLIRKFLNDLMVNYENQQEQQKVENKNENFYIEIANCCRENLLCLLKYLIEDQGAQLDTKNEFLIEASRNGHKDILTFLLEKGIDINQNDKSGYTALMWASREGHKEIVKMLLEKDSIEINQKDKLFGQTALMWASEYGHEEIVKMLLEKENIDINQKDWKGQTALITASDEGHKEIVKMLLQHKNIDINQTDDEEGKTALMMTSIKGNEEIVKMLLEKDNIEINQTDKWGQTALMWASREGHKEILKMLLEEDNIDINQQDKDGMTALIYASEKGHKEIVKMLLQKDNIDINQTDRYGWTALMLASSEGHKEIVKMLLEEDNIDINQTDEDGQTALMYASEKGHKEIVKMLLQKDNIDINQTDEGGYTALMYASEKSHAEIVKMLLEKDNIDINQKDKLFGQTALMWASEYGHEEIVKMLLEKENIDINQTDKYWGATALMLASEKGHAEIVKMLLEKVNIEINQTDSVGETALMYASKEGHTEIVKILLEKDNIDINQTNTWNGQTALMRASEEGHTEIVKMLEAKEKEIKFKMNKLEDITTNGLNKN
jgi:ankyrin repeat protein